MNDQTRPSLNRGVSLSGFFSLAFGSMIGVGWVTALGSWLEQAGPGGAIAAFLLGGALMMLIGLCYAELTPMLPVAGGEVAYAYAASGTGFSFAVGWFLAFGYLSISAFEAISIGRVLSYLVPAIDLWPLYEVTGEPVYGSHLLLGFALTAAITWTNYRGVQLAARGQTILTVSFIVLVIVFIGAGLFFGEMESAGPWFVTDAEGSENWGGVLAVLVTAPFWFVGFDTIPQAAEEAEAAIPPRTLGVLILASIAGAALFYALLILSVAGTGPWRALVNSELPTAVAFERAFSSPVFGRLVLVSALVGLLTSWNGFFLAGSRVLFAMGRGNIIPPRFGETHARHGSPTVAVVFAGLATAAGAALGRGGMLMLVDVGSLAIAAAFLGVAFSTIKLRRSKPDLPRPYLPAAGLWPARLAVGGGCLLLLAMLVPSSPAALRWPGEWLILAAVLASGAVLWTAGAKARSQTSEDTRARLVLGRYI